VDLQVPPELCTGERTEEALKQWIWLNHKDKILEHVIVQCCAAKRKEEGAPNMDLDASTKCETEKTDDGCSPTDKSATSSISPCAHRGSTLQTAKSLDLLATIVRVHRKFFDSESPKIVFGYLLDAVLELMNSEYGFIGEVKYEDDVPTMPCHHKHCME
jgi:hypothetical protein